MDRPCMCCDGKDCAFACVVDLLVWLGYALDMDAFEPGLFTHPKDYLIISPPLYKPTDREIMMYSYGLVIATDGCAGSRILTQD